MIIEPVSKPGGFKPGFGKTAQGPLFPLIKGTSKNFSF
jgi:hypothetical protein